jgi:hypothetical protein
MLEILPRNGYKKQANAIAYHNQRNERMLSFPDVFQLDNTNLEELRKDWGGFRWTVTSTRIDYSKNIITHNADSSVVKPTIIKLKYKIPVCGPTYINELIETKEGLEYIRALINKAKATKQDILSELKRISGKEANKIRFWTPPESSRIDNPIRAVRLYFDSSGFVVGGYVWVDVNSSFSRGVRQVNTVAKQQSKIQSKTLIIQIKREELKNINKIELNLI